MSKRPSISRFNPELTREHLVYRYLVNIDGHEIEMETRCKKKARIRYQEQQLEVWQNTAFKREVDPARLPEKYYNIFIWLRENVVDSYTPIARNLKELSEKIGTNLGVTQKGTKFLAEEGYIKIYSQRGHNTNTYIKL